ncbi:CYTH and CHAD domain-containing protein [Insolitispirillum peregrinum]|uniref:Inorganic triphosphatase YgiF, contains CYTH and CHAD domains n=1 Tax=Insolitispirillum peregrinum TaxID=80876 RepID=A0A1N7Q5Q0_9PROT|nr:CYTH and CHAD domain-containing protein [Insolitispirillum peregrinum]SIT18161.1 Inorganic triphosphatase YgiF, contains CYTH and CHAD domains [Insolitispirillum peregrinum]
MHVEVELKLELPLAALERLRRHPFVRTHKQGRAQSLHLYNTYYDTPDCDLARQKAALRLRRNGTQFFQTVKTKGDHQGAHFSRPEWEWPVAGEALDVSLLAETPLASLSAPVLAAVRPLFTTDFKRTVWLLSAPEESPSWQIELTIDQGEIRPHGTTSTDSEAICEVELELKHGEPRDLYHAALTLTEGLPVRISVLSKAERGYALARPRPSRAQKGSAPALKKNDTVAEALQSIGQACLGHALLNEPLLRRLRHPEAVHQMRVALRRFRSALSVFKPVLGSPHSLRVKDDLRWLAGELGDARDLDVFSDEILAPAAVALGDGIDLSPLQSLISHRRELAYQRALEALESPRSGQTLLHAAAWLENGDWLTPDAPEQQAILNGSLRPFARQLLDHRLKSVLRAGQHFGTLDSLARHAVRIEVKKLRYTCEFFSSLFSEKKQADFNATLSDLQEHLGAINDAAVARQKLSAIAQEGPADLTLACGAVIGWHQARMEDTIKDCGKSWKQFQKQEPFWH